MQETDTRQREREAAEAAQREVFDAWQAALPQLLPHPGGEMVTAHCSFATSSLMSSCHDLATTPCMLLADPVCAVGEQMPLRGVCVCRMN